MGHLAGLPGVLAQVGGKPGRLELVRRQEPRDGLLDLIGGEIRGASLEVGDGVEGASALHDSKADRIQVGVEDVGAVGRGFHPLVLDHLRVRSQGDVFRDSLEVRARLRRARGQIGFAGVLVRELSFLCEPLRMRLGGLGEGVVPLERGQALLGAGLVCFFEEKLLLRR